MRAALLPLLLGARVTALDNGVGRTPPLGWSTWQTCGDGACGHDVCTEGEVKEAALAMRQNGMQALGYSYLNMDDCWEATNRTSDGHITWDASRFPSGIPALTSWLHERGFKFGLYTSAGTTTCANRMGSRGHYARDADDFASWGVDYIKLDWCGDIKDDLLAGAKAHRDFAAAVNKSGRAMFVEVVAGFFFLGAEHIHEAANSWRFWEKAWSTSGSVCLDVLYWL